MRRAALIALLGSTACTLHLRRNAPGNVDPRTPPFEIDVQEVEAPGDPGEDLYMLSVGGFGGVGGGVGPDFRSTNRAGEAGPEIGFHWGSDDESHAKPDLFPFMFPHTWPRRSVGFNVGMSVLSPSGDEAAVGRVYAEYQKRDSPLWAWAVGYGVDPDDGAHGPHATVLFATYYLRVGYELDRGATILVGGFLKIPTVFVRSR